MRTAVVHDWLNGMRGGEKVLEAILPLLSQPTIFTLFHRPGSVSAAIETKAPQIGPMVTAVGYRNPDLIAYQAGTIDQLSGGRFVLGIGAGWFERDYEEFGFEFGEARDRLRALQEALPRIKARIAKLKPGAAGPMPILIGGGGEKVTLRLVAEHAQMWNGMGDAATLRRKNDVIDEWCGKLGRDPAEEVSFDLDATETEAPNTNSFFGPGGYAIWASDTSAQKVRGCITISSGLGSDITKCLDMTFQ